MSIKYNEIKNPFDSGVSFSALKSLPDKDAVVCAFCHKADFIEQMNKTTIESCVHIKELDTKPYVFYLCNDCKWKLLNGIKGDVFDRRS